MKSTYSIILLIVTVFVLCSCVSRTISATSIDSTGIEDHGKVIEKKTIWFWQDEFKNP